MKNNSISVIGCGWLGLPLAKQLVSLNYLVKGSTTSRIKLSNLENIGISPFLIELNESNIKGNIEEFLKDSEVLIINIPPGIRKNPNKNHVAEIAQLMSYVEKSTVKYVLYVSSTSVYADAFPFPTITEQTPPNGTLKSAKQLIEIEKSLKENTNFKTTILRFSGLFDANRHPGKILSGREDIQNPEAPVNLIHKDDCIGIIQSIIEKQFWDATLNASFPYHPTKKEYYTNYCQKHNLQLPKFQTGNTSKGKIIDGSLLAQLLKYEYQTSP
ncbi:nucleoside-diphosphate-sugar epimerase [Winogradskyella wandonensis]|uniref:Nucleoside-diphosphate-sugar epimerase n=1 Tax=Winogradskyella wandonensis TaxID=1442586 RepID=A0A4R1KRP7_9FLAO|nr:NAD-dependent epimerase/dehydratase family protein [Winogradskyella wandonensis]TCK67694.1 nucleoside-diphosphate-sugar epimerase [Winogradskyella wandonensis]